LNIISDPYGFIYITTNMVNGKRYIGQKKFDNVYKWKSYLGSGRYFLKSVEKYGKDNFIRNIVDIAYSPEELNKKEILWIENYNAVKSEDFYNAIEGGNTGNHLKRKNSISVICIDNNKIFKSIADASLWSGYTAIKIKRSFKIKHTYDNYENESYIFRLLPETKLNKRVCCICGKFLSKDMQWCKMCSKCDEEVKKVNKLKKCRDCGIKFKSNSNKQCRCQKCQHERNKENNRISAKKRRNLGKKQKVKNSAFQET
jgi:hypothetical protein